MHRAFAVLVLSVFVAGLIGCGGSSEPSGGASGPAASSSPAPPQLSGPPPGAAPGGAPAAAPAAGAEGSPAAAAEGSAAPPAASGAPGGSAGGPPPGAFPPGMVPGVGTMPSGGSSGSPPPGLSMGGGGSPPPGYTGGSPPPGMNPSAATGATAGGPPPGAFPPGMVPGVGTMPSGGSSGSPPPGSAGGPPAGYSGGSPPPGYSGGSPPPGYSGGSPPPGYAGGGSPPQGSLVPGAQTGSPGGSTPGVPAGYPGMPPGAGGLGGPGGLTAPGAESPAGGLTSGVPAGYPGMPGGHPGLPGGAGAPGTPGAPGAAPAAPPGYNTLAQTAFSQGREADALKYLYAYALTSDEGASEVLPKIQWCSGLSQPVLAVRWGVGAVVTPDSYKSDLKPVGSNQNLPQKKGKQGGPEAPGGGAAPAMPGPGMMRPEGGMGGPGGATGAGSNAVLAQFAGELGERFLTDFQTRVQGGSFGEVLRDAPLPGSVAAGGSAGYGGGSPAGYSGGPPPGLGGAPGMAIGAGAESPSGHPMMPSGMGGPPGMGGAAGAKPVAAGAVPQITTGLCFLGLDTQDRLVQKAAKEGVQVLLLVNVKITVNRKTNLVTNETSLQLINVAKKEKPLYATADFNNLKIQNERASNKNDGVKEEFDKLFKVIDGSLVVGAPPSTLNAANVLGRVSALVAAKNENVLPVLAEIRYWNRKNLLPEPEMLNAYKQLLGEEQGNQLATGDEAAKKKAIEKLLPRS